MNDFKNIKAIVFDLDGTLYSGNQAIPYAVETLAYLQKKGIEIFYLTNNSSRTVEQIKDKLSGLGYKATVEKTYSSLSTSVSYLKQQNIKKAFCIGSKELIHELQLNGIAVVNNTEDVALAEVVLVGVDTELSYKKIADVYRVFQLNPKCKLIACNLDRNYPVENGLRMPGCGAGVAAIENVIERKADYIVGKPNSYMLELLCKEWNLNKNEVLVVGDALDSDVAMAENFGCKSILFTDKKYPDIIITIPSIQTLQQWF